MKKMTQKMMKKTILLSLLFFGLTACSEPPPQSRAVYMLLDTSGTYTNELTKAKLIINYLLATLDGGDSLAIARIDSGSFSEKDLISKATFDTRPSVINEQKRAFKRRVDHFVKNVKSSAFTDISGGVLQASEYLHETDATQKYILIFSDLEEDLVKGHVRDFSIPLVAIKVVALNVTKLRSDNIDPRDYLKRVANWQIRVNEGGGQWQLLNDLEHLEKIIQG